MAKKILITGGTGFLGWNIHQYLRKNVPEADIFLFSRRTGGNIKDTTDVEKAIEGKDLVIHAAAQTHVDAGLKGTEEGLQQFFETNVEGTINVVNACKKWHVPMIHISTAEVYGSNQFPGKPMTEGHPLNPQMGTYAVSKLEAERIVQNEMKNGLNARIIRPFGMFGLFQSREKFFPKMIQLLKQGNPLTIHGDGQQIRDYLSVEDVARAVWMIRETPSGTIVNAASGKPNTLLEMAQMLIKSCKRHGIEGKIEYVEDRPNQVKEYRGSFEKIHKLVGWKPEKTLESEVNRLVDAYLGVEIEPPKMFYEEERTEGKMRRAADANESIRVEYATAVYGEKEIAAAVEVLRGRWLAPAKKTDEFQQKIAKIFGKKFGLFVNSGSSANLLALLSLGLPKNKKIITPACTFATTFSSILQAGLEPVLVDSDIGTYNAKIEEIEQALKQDTEKQIVAIMVPHTVGNLNNMAKLREIADRHQLKLIEDSCDTLGASIQGKPTGTWSDATTGSFYFVHHITAAGGGGIVLFDDEKALDKAWSIRDWGRRGVGYDENIEERFAGTINGIPYDSKFVFSNIGYNFKGIEVQAAFGLVQLEQLEKFNQTRAKNMKTLFEFFKKYEKFFITPTLLPDSETYFLSFPMTIRKGAPFTRVELLNTLEQKNIQTRPLFAGNIIRHPAYKNTQYTQIGKLENADYIMQNSFVAPCHHGLTEKHLEYMFQQYDHFLKKF